MESEAGSVISCILIGPGPRKRDRKTVSAVRFGPSASRPAMPALRSIATGPRLSRSEEHTSELQSLMRNSYAVFCLKKKKDKKNESCIISEQRRHTSKPDI